MRHSVAAFALIHRTAAGGVAEWLANWNDHWHALNLVGGHQRPGESFRDCCAREVAEELRLAPGTDFRVAPERDARLTYEAQSGRTGEPTFYEIELFTVDLLTDAARAAIDADPDNAWLTEREIRSLAAADGRAVSGTVERVLVMAGLIPKAEEYDLFVSYAHADDHDGFVTALADALQAEHQAFARAGLRLFFDRHAVRTGHDWEHRIRGGLRAAKALLTVLSPAYFESDWCRREWETFLDHERERAWPGDPLQPVYAVGVPDFTGPDADARRDWLRRQLQAQYCDLLDWRPHGVAAFRQEEVRARLRALDQQVTERVRRVESVGRSPSNAPRHNPNFVGRADELKRVHETLTTGRVGAITAVHGVGGMGKTALAAEYGHLFAEFYPGGRFWLPAERADDLRDLLRQLEAPLGLAFTDEERKDRDAGYRRVRAELEGRPPSLVVLDNVDRPELLRPAHLAAYRPSGERVHVLVTTREEPAADPGGGVVPIPLDRLNAEDGRKLLRQYRDFGADEAEWHAARQIVERLGGHALSLELVGVTVWQRNRTEPLFGYGACLAWLESEGVLGLLDGAASDDTVSLSRHTEKVVSRLLRPTLERLSEPERRALEYAALLPADWVVLPWLRELVGQDFPEAVTKAKPWQADPWLRLVDKLRGWRLLVPGPDGRVAKMHRVMQAVVSGAMDEEMSESRLTALIDVARDRGKVLWDGWVDRAARWEITPLQQFADHLLSADRIEGGNLASYVQQPLSALGLLPDARRLLRRAIPIEERHLGPDHPDVAASCSNLATVEQDLGDLAEARRLLRRAIALEEKHFGPDHPTLAISYSNLALVEHALGDLAQARLLLKRAVAIEEKHFDPDHPKLAIRYSNLALVEHALGDLAEARRLQKRAIEIKEKHFGPDHPTLAISYSNLAGVEQNLGDLPEARRLLKRAIEIDQKHFDSYHPNLAIRYWNLAMLEDQEGHLAEAREQARRAYYIRLAKLGPQHPNTRTAAEWLAENDPEFQPPSP